MRANMSLAQYVPEIIKRKVPKLRFIFALLQFFVFNSGLHHMGWFLSAWKEQAIDKNGAPIPWIPYSAIYFLNQRVNKNLTVFEFGCGNSTIWWAKKTKFVVSVEHDEYWANKMKRILPENAEILYRKLDDNYPLSITNQPYPFDIVFIDGRMRTACALNAVNNLTPKGVIIWDNSDRDRYKEGMAILKLAGFKHLDFYGMMPIDNIASLSSIFYRESNVLGI